MATSNLNPRNASTQLCDKWSVVDWIKGGRDAIMTPCLDISTCVWCECVYVLACVRACVCGVCVCDYVCVCDVWCMSVCDMYSWICCVQLDVLLL